MFLTINNPPEAGKKIIITNNNVKVNKAFIIINCPIKQEQIIIQNNNIQFEQNACFIIDNNETPSNIYANFQHIDIPRIINVNSDQVVLFNDLNNQLSYINKNKEKVFLIQGEIQK